MYKDQLVPPNSTESKRNTRGDITKPEGKREPLEDMKPPMLPYKPEKEWLGASVENLKAKTPTESRLLCKARQRLLLSHQETAWQDGFWHPWSTFKRKVLELPSGWLDASRGFLQEKGTETSH